MEAVRGGREDEFFRRDGDDSASSSDLSHGVLSECGCGVWV